MAVYGENNAFKRPVGSGWYAANLEPGQCGAKKALIYGERFDANGQVTAVGFAAIDPKTHELVVSATPVSTP